MTTFPYRAGKPLAWDFTIVDILCPTYCHTSPEESCKTLEKAELSKIHKHRQLTDFHFIPIGAETLGPFAVQFLENQQYQWRKTFQILSLPVNRNIHSA